MQVFLQVYLEVDADIDFGPFGAFQNTVGPRRQVSVSNHMTGLAKVMKIFFLFYYGDPAGP